MCYNPFLRAVGLANNGKVQKKLNELAQTILDIRAIYAESSLTLADLYNPFSMPTNLRRVHNSLGKYVDSLYKKSDFTKEG